MTGSVSVAVERQRARVAQARVKLGSACADCGATDNLQFDHVDPATKRYPVTRMTGLSDERFWAEVAKCDLRCKRCHFERGKALGHFGERVNSPDRVDGAPPGHGCRSGYQRAKCRCSWCVEWCRLRNAARADYRKERRQRLGSVSAGGPVAHRNR